MKVEIAVIGSGPGGAVTARLLAEAGRDVLLIEEGRRFDLGSCAPFSIDEMRQKYRSAGITVALGRCKMPYVEGCVVGGGSEINSALYRRTPAAVLDEWGKNYDVKGLSEKDLLPHFEANERELSVGPLRGAAAKSSLKLVEGASHLGLDPIEVPRMFSYSDHADAAGVARGTRQSMSRTYIPEFLKSNGRLASETRIVRLARQGSGWLLRGFQRRATVEIEAEHVFAACGAIQTPALLRRSGIRHNIGNSLKMSPMLKVLAEFPEDVNADGIGTPVYQVRDDSEGITLGCSIGTPAQLGLILLDHPEHRRGFLHFWKRMAVFYVQISGAGSGNVRPVYGFKDPLVRYTMTEQDLGKLSRGFAGLSKLLFAAGAVHLYPALSGFGRLSNLNDVNRIPECLGPDSTNLVSLHLTSSCPMGENKKITATDSFGKVHGPSNLYIADASFLCGSPGVNPQGSILAIARRNALKFLGRI